MESLQDLSYNEILDLTISYGLPKYRAKQIYEMSLSYDSWEENTTLPKTVRAHFENYSDKAIKIIKEVQGTKGVVKLLYLLNDGNIIEGVYLPNNYGNTLCISTQVGCAMGCVFCASGANGLMRNLSAGEILSQVLAVNKYMGGDRQKRAISNLVLMGSGEPLDNYDNLIKFLKMVTSKEGINISARNITISTCGIPEKIISLAKENIPVTLTISLHASSDAKRELIMPVARLYPLKEIISSADFYFEKTGRRISFEYILTKENTDEKSIHDLILLISGRKTHINLIELNDTPEGTSKRVRKEEALTIQKALEEKGFSVTIRRSLGSDIEGACGQLRNTFVGQNQGENTPK